MTKTITNPIKSGELAYALTPEEILENMLRDKDDDIMRNMMYLGHPTGTPGMISGNTPLYGPATQIPLGLQNYNNIMPRGQATHAGNYGPVPQGRGMPMNIPGYSQMGGLERVSVNYTRPDGTTYSLSVSSPERNGNGEAYSQAFHSAYQAIVGKDSPKIGKNYGAGKSYGGSSTSYGSGRGSSKGGGSNGGK